MWEGKDECQVIMDEGSDTQSSQTSKKKLSSSTTNEISDTDLIREPQSSEELMLTPSLGEHFTSGNVHLPLVKRRERPKEFITLGCFNNSKRGL